MNRYPEHLDAHAEFSTLELLLLGACIAGNTLKTAQGVLGLGPVELRRLVATMYDRTGARDRGTLAMWSQQHRLCCLGGMP